MICSLPGGVTGGGFTGTGGVITVPRGWNTGMGCASTAVGGVTTVMVSRVVRQASHWCFAAEHVGQSLNAPLVVAAPQLAHLPTLSVNALPAQFGHNAAVAED